MYELSTTGPPLREVFLLALDWGGTIDDQTRPRDETLTHPLAAGVPELIEAIRASKRAVVIATGTRPGQDRTTAAEPIRELLAERLLLQSDQLGVGKASEEFWQAICDETGYLPREIAYVGNNLETDIIWPLEFGMQAVLIRPGDRRPPELPADAHWISHLAELLPLLGR
jgi:FMN phosphatase YigB (HAD superfamily)